MKRRFAVAAITAIAATFALFAWRAPQPEARVGTANARPGARVEALLRAHARQAATGAPPSYEDSLRGTAVDGTVNFDANGRPLADRDLRRLFDYFLTRLGERTPAQIRDDILAHLRDVLHLDRRALAQILDWFDAYTATERAVAELPRSGDLRKDLLQAYVLREQRLGQDLARAWYGGEDAYAAYTAERLALAHDATLSAADKAQRLAELDATLDPVERENYHAATDFQLAVAQTEEFAADGTDAATRYAERAALWGGDAATRLEQLDQTEAEWNGRVDAYAQARARVLANGALGPAAREAQLAALLGGFSEPEQRRLLSLVQADLLPHH